ncbi:MULTISPECIES: hypothetical protein [Pantoea]|uniref:hypothetical protein n=1 Tax=Pantoea TaxID=53335 RepID=UPI00289312CF|nr:hypothetical protein [Pantoea sp. ACRSB]MCG7391108.1 hypothetical protein [Pantoea sp. ACRSB]
MRKENTVSQRADLAIQASVTQGLHHAIKIDDTCSDPYWRGLRNGGIASLLN